MTVARTIDDMLTVACVNNGAQQNILGLKVAIWHYMWHVSA